MKEFNLRELTKRGCTRREEKDFRDEKAKILYDYITNFQEDVYEYEQFESMEYRIGE